ncbi:MAG: hypothetical protein H8E44_01310 [Planctomycetes bacterium]|nr:hypothetical protein [Planctomycetota bacterium]
MSATEVTNLQTRRAAIIAELAALDATKAGGVPNAIGGVEEIDHQGYKQGLYDELARINELIAQVSGPWEVRS